MQKVPVSIQVKTSIYMYMRLLLCCDFQFLWNVIFRLQFLSPNLLQSLLIVLNPRHSLIIFCTILRSLKSQRFESSRPSSGDRERRLQSRIIKNVTSASRRSWAKHNSIVSCHFCRLTPSMTSFLHCPS